MKAQRALFLRGVEKRAGNQNGHPFDLPFIAALTTLELRQRITFIIGENGSGKSTLLEAVAVALGFNPEGGGLNFNFTTEASHSPLHNCLHLVRGPYRPKDGYFLRAESFYNVASEIDRLDREPGCGRKIIASYGGRSLHRMSHGESFMALAMNRFNGGGLYLLDEPEAALSPTRQLALLARIDELARQNAQFLIATHSPILLGCPNAEILQVSDNGLCPVCWEDTGHVAVTRQFLNRRDAVLRQLLPDGSPPDLSGGTD